ncbi:hypothetical protein [Mycobacterium parmense]|uniref:Uncharacterized protein n=1 Tax=Mycobacterium parmense TaxID=185642 RepID=A0A7I7Z0R8_9MYCO|nr:hypothetical protein [Mycobacterium parmense]MCV7352815.1 hypothetical protein [Mycobacterium parmense]ORW52785.1 hypothetical protein AWC20_20930 [Mycobacterium parmense]BBZ46824.1 hypothetical protein MPRM_41050 [Mycobacterium parmense]
MHAVTRLGGSAAITVALVAGFQAGTATAEGGTTVVLDAKLRRCDFSLVSFAPMVPHPALGTGTAVVRRAGSRVVAQVHVVDEPEPGTHFDVGLIQEPRPAAATCGPGDPGTAFTGLDTDATGSATATVSDTLRPGTTGVWVIVEQPNPHSQNPGEFYTSEFVAPV